MSALALQASQLSVSLGGRRVLQGVDVAIAAGRWTSVVGPNGAGKSTLLKALAGLLPCEGRVLLAARPLAEWTPQDRARQLAWLGQSEATADDLTAWDVAMLGRLPHRGWLAAPTAQDHAAVERALRAMHAWDWRGRRLGELSGGERQRVLLARALAVQAPLLLLDEPAANLDPPHQADWVASMRALVAAGGTVVSVLHEIALALHADDVLVLETGRVVHAGPVADDAAQRAIEAVFQGRIGLRSALGKPFVLLNP